MGPISEAWPSLTLPVRTVEFNRYGLQKILQPGDYTIVSAGSGGAMLRDRAQCHPAESQQVQGGWIFTGENGQAGMMRAVASLDVLFREMREERDELTRMPTHSPNSH